MAKQEKPAGAMRTLSARVPAATMKAFRQRVLAEDKTVQAVVNELVAEYLKKRGG